VSCKEDLETVAWWDCFHKLNILDRLLRIPTSLQKDTSEIFYENFITNIFGIHLILLLFSVKVMEDGLPGNGVAFLSALKSPH
jgi:hypothetical protein